MNLYLVLGATNSVISYAELYEEEALAIEAVTHFLGCVPVQPAGGSVASSQIDNINRRALYLPLQVDQTQCEKVLYVLVSSVPYLHSTTRARVFYAEAAAKSELRSFNSAVSRTTFHAYLLAYTFPGLQRLAASLGRKTET